MDADIKQQAEEQVRQNLHDVVPLSVFQRRVEQLAQALLKENHGSQSGSTAA